jgi:hypothetical protein
MNVTVAIKTDKPVTADTMLKALAEGTVVLHKVRSNGTFRKVHFLADGTKEREVAEWVANERAEGKRMKDIAKDALLSVAAVRRILNDLALTEELEEAEADELDAMLQGAAELAAAEKDAIEAN